MVINLIQCLNILKYKYALCSWKYCVNPVVEQQTADQDPLSLYKLVTPHLTSNLLACNLLSQFHYISPISTEFQYVLRKENNDWVKKCMEYEVEGARPRGRKENLEIVEKDCRARGLNREDAMDRSIWRKQIVMIDDQDESEWVSVSSGTSSPGLSQTKYKEP